MHRIFSSCQCIRLSVHCTAENGLMTLHILSMYISQKNVYNQNEKGDKVSCGERKSRLRLGKCQAFKELRDATEPQEEEMENLIRIFN